MRSIDDIYNEMLAAKNADTRLSSLNSASSTAVWRLLFYVMATVIFILDSLYEKLRLALMQIRDSAVPGTPSWYRAKALEWQDGDVLVVDQSVIAYAAVNLAAREIKRAAVTEQPDGTILIKVATETAPLTAPQITSVQEYFRQIHFAGTIFGVISLNADKLRVFGDAYYDPQVGQAATLANIEAAILDYLKALPFNSAIHLSRVMDAIQGAHGVTDAYNISLMIDSGSGFSSAHRTMVPLSGWFVLDTAMVLSSTLNLIVNV